MIQTQKTLEQPQINMDRLSVLTAVITLAYILTRFINLPPRELSIQLPGIFLSMQINIRTVISILVAGLAAAGADWLLYEHPNLKNRLVLPHCLLPSLTALMIGIPLNQLPLGIAWWGVLFGGILLFGLVVVAEFITLGEEDFYQRLASASLTAVSLALYLALAAGLRSTGMRLFFTLPILAVGGGLVSMRVLNLRLHGQWLVYEALFIGFLVAQVAAALYYWPLNPVSYGLLVLGPAYALVSLFISMIDELPLRQAWAEPSLAIILSIAAVMWLS